MKKRFSPQTSLLIISIFTCIILASCAIENHKPWYINTTQLWKDYHAAVTDARTAETSEICHTLPAITFAGDNPQIEWRNENGKAFVLVGSMIAANDANEWQKDNNALPNNTLLWITLPYELENHLRRSPLCSDSLECRMRIIQLLGLPPDCNYDRMVFFYAERDRLLRPSPDPEIDDHKASLDFSVNVSEDYRTWFAENYAFSYESDTPYPWTRLGYTYNWNRESESVIGPGEFIVPADAQVRLKKIVTIWTWYQEITQGVAHTKL